MGTEEATYEDANLDAVGPAYRRVRVKDMVLFWAIGTVFMLVTGAITMILFFGFVASMLGG